MINSIQRQQFSQRMQPQQMKRSTPAAEGMMSSFEKMIGEVNQSQIVAETKIAETIAGRNKDIAGTMIAMEKAEISMRLLLTIRNKMISAYEEIMRMQV